MKVLITGGGGFLGSGIARRILLRADTVTVLGRHRYRRLESLGIESVQGDIRDADGVRQACQGMDLVFHVAALTALWGKRRDFWSINVDGTRNVIDACKACGVGRLVFTSTPSVVFGDKSRCGADERLEYPSKHLAFYPETKAAAERMVLEANSPSLATVAIRPHLIWGPEDPHLIPRVLQRAKRGKLMQVGDGTNKVDITYIDNAVSAHVLAAGALAMGNRCAGKAYFISQGEPVILWSWLGKILEELSLPAVVRRVTYRRAYLAGALLELSNRFLGIPPEPMMTRFLAAQLSHSHHFDTQAAGDDLGYTPAVSTRQGVEWLLEHLRSRQPD